jgi:hypothetical protein
MTRITPDVRGGPRPHHQPLVLEVDHAIVVGLRRAAVRRDLPIRALINSLLDTLACDATLIDAVLDDREA